MNTYRNLIARQPIAIVVFFACVTCAAHAQIDRHTNRWDSTDRVAPSPLEELRKIDEAMSRESPRRRAAPFREGSLLIDVQATFNKHETTGAWMATLVIDEPTTGQSLRDQAFAMMPNAFLDEAQHMMTSASDYKLTLEITAETFTYDSQSYLLLRAPVRVIAEARIEREATPPPEPVRNDQPGQDSPRSAADVMRELERETGPMHRPPGDIERASTGARERHWREGTLLVARRGRITRDGGGAWKFVFDADSQGLSDPPLTLLPCLMLERVERFAQRVGPTAPILISGQVFMYEDRGYLLTSAFQLAYERTPLH